MLALNGVATRFSLSGPEQAQGQGRRRADLARCAEERARTVASLAELFVSGGLQTERSGPAVSFADRSIDSVEVILAVGERLKEVGRELARRHAARATLVLADEYDYRTFFAPCCGSSSMTFARRITLASRLAQPVGLTLYCPSLRLPWK